MQQIKLNFKRGIYMFSHTKHVKHIIHCTYSFTIFRKEWTRITFPLRSLYVLQLKKNDIRSFYSIDFAEILSDFIEDT